MISIERQGQQQAQYRVHSHRTKHLLPCVLGPSLTHRAHHLQGEGGANGTKLPKHKATTYQTIWEKDQTRWLWTERVEINIQWQSSTYRDCFFPGFFLIYLIHFIIPFGKFGPPYLVVVRLYHYNSCKSSATQSYKCMLGLFVFPSSTALWHGLQDL